MTFQSKPLNKPAAAKPMPAKDLKIIRVSDQPRDLSFLPPPDTKRWVVSRKAQVITAVNKGFLTIEDACARYNLSEEEVRSWMKLSQHGGASGDKRRSRRRKIPAER
jgi:hypothetical protein